MNWTYSGAGTQWPRVVYNALTPVKTKKTRQRERERERENARQQREKGTQLRNDIGQHCARKKRPTERGELK